MDVKERLLSSNQLIKPGISENTCYFIIIAIFRHVFDHLSYHWLAEWKFLPKYCRQISALFPPTAIGVVSTETECPLLYPYATYFFSIPL